MPRMRSDRDFLAGANRSMEDNLTRDEPAIFTSYGLIGSILFFGGAGLLLDHLMGTSPWLLLAGVAIGCVAGFLGLYRLLHRLKTGD